jgi:hypothetical protein
LDLASLHIGEFKRGGCGAEVEERQKPKKRATPGPSLGISFSLIQ